MYDSLDDFDYSYPPELVAQHPLPERDGSRMMVVDRSGATVNHARVLDLPSHLRPGDTLVINTTRVFKARLRATRENGREAEVLLVRPSSNPNRWLAMVHPGGKLKTGRTVTFGDAVATVTDVLGGGLREIELHHAEGWEPIIDAYGSLPLPPYIERAPQEDDASRYQTVFARETGSVAAPTAGLHFTPALLDAVRNHDVHVADIVLHVGPGTFKPVQTDDIDQHTMHAEWYEVTEDVAGVINDRRAAGGRTVAVGTTVTRVLESVVRNGRVEAGEGWTDLFIRPGYSFGAVDAMLTNFHLPRSTLLMLVTAFGGYELVMGAYHQAVKERYRLYSYGDAMLLT